jgi:GH15 family glucan-1,4-alpha-glucosidase
MSEAQRYPPIRDYAAIGDCHGAALISLEGSVDWCCLGRFDADPALCRVLDAGRGGFLSITPPGERRTRRAYLPGTNILETRHATHWGEVAVTDFMPVGRSPEAGVHDYVTLAAPHWLVRVVECLSGRCQVDVRYRPTIDFARRPASLTSVRGRISSGPGPYLQHDLDFSLAGDVAESRFTLEAGERRHLVVSREPVDAVPLVDRVQRLREITSAFWEEWSQYCRYAGQYRDAVLRSALTLKLLTYSPSGAIIAAPTTSLPQEIGGTRNWDYRYCWLRDSAFTLYALADLGYSGEARAFARFVAGSCAATRPAAQIMYGIGGETALAEHLLEHLEGYSRSAPVRVGNAAVKQRQLDVCGEVLDWAHLYSRLGGRLDDRVKSFLAGLADLAAARWSEPDQGIWEVRRAPRHHVHGKIMAWVALDRAIRLLGDRQGWSGLRDTIRRSVEEHGIDPQTGGLTQAYGEPGADAALLTVPSVGFPLDDATFARTVATIEQRLRRGDYVLRYDTDDGIEGNEGAFLVCSFWLVDALLHLDRAAEARALFERLLAYASDVGLYSEEVDPTTHAFLGNFPQGFTHLALIESATNLLLYEKGGARALAGTHADRARFTVEATAGPFALWAAFRRSHRVGRLWRSRRSMMPAGWAAALG